MYISKVKLPNNTNTYYIKDKEVRTILGGDYAIGQAYSKGDYVIYGDDGSKQLYQVNANISSADNTAWSKMTVTTVKLIDELGNTVDLNSDQTITGIKTIGHGGEIVIGQEGSLVVESGSDLKVAPSDVHVDDNDNTLQTLLDAKQNKLTAGSNITISSNNTISATIPSIPSAGSSATAVGSTSSSGSASTWSRSDHVHNIVVGTGDSNGQVKIAGQNATVKGLGSNAYTSTEYIPATQKGSASGVATLDSNKKIPLSQIPDAIAGQLVYGGTVNASNVATLSTNAKSLLAQKTGYTIGNTATLTNAASSAASSGTLSTLGWTAAEGMYFIMEGNSSFASLDLKVGDWLISTGSAWKKIDNTDAVTSVNNKTGAVTISGSKKALGASATGTKVTVNTQSISFGNASVGTAVDVGTALGGTTTFNTGAIKSATCSQKFLTSGLASASLTGTKTFRTTGVVMAIDSTDSEMLVFSDGANGTVGLSTSNATASAVTINTAAAGTASVTLTTKSINPATTGTGSATVVTGIASVTNPEITLTKSTPSGLAAEITVLDDIN